MNKNDGWARWDGGGPAWDKTLLSIADFNLYQSWTWGLHRAEFGWTQLPFTFYADGKITSMAMVLVRKKLRAVAVCWIPGGPVGDLATSCKSLLEAVRSATNTCVTYLHISSMAKFSDITSMTLKSASWRPSQIELNSGKSLIYDAFDDDIDRRRLLTKNWERNLSRGESRGLDVSEWNSASGFEIAEITDRMRAYKKIDNSSNVKLIADSLLHAFGDQIILARCTDSTGTMLAIRGVIKFGNKAYDMFSAASPEGRKQYASNLCLWKIIELCARDGITHFDLSGVDPVENKGVYDFKKGIGAKDLNYLGEWSLIRPQILGPVLSRMISRRLNA